MEAVCRICRSNCVTLVNIFDQLEQDPPLVDMLKECGNCKISSKDPLPQNICLACILDAQNAFQFKRRCEHSQQYFLLLLGVGNKDNSACEDVPLECTPYIKEEPLEIIPQGSSLGNETLEDNTKISQALQPGVEKKEISDSEQNVLSHCTIEIKQEILGTFSVDNETYEECESSSRVDTKKTGKTKLYPCLTCGKVFSLKRQLTKHTLVHTEDHPYKCNYCSKTFQTINHRRVHMRLHSGQRRFKCKECHGKFSSRIVLKRHMFNHAGEPPHKCPHCLTRFSHRDNLNKHLRIHLEDGEHKCPHCQKLFRYAYILDEHIRTDKCTYSRYKCPLCMKTLFSEGFLRRHMDIHARSPKIGAKVPQEMQTGIDNSEDRKPSLLSLVDS
ncbi:uncharacterized protein Dvir_GJ11513 [Drosophila virilis]|uniref:Protein krueppel n=1 Tax=Drosophila virilis TaxID=7244 RepID=B4LGE4_DROVI|nr:uncharacterized protein Dvir_GJ11513 [Drosophila virilis]